MKPFLKKWLIKHIPILVLLTLLVIITYANSLNNAFVSDDLPTIVNNKNIASLTFIISQPLSFLPNFLHLLAYKIGGLNPIAFRSINILFHIGSVWIVYFLLSYMTKSPLPLFTAALFAVHPINIDAVVWISGGPHVWSGFLSLLALFAYIHSRKHKLLYLFSLASFLTATATNQKMIILPLILILYDYCFNKIEWKRILPFFILLGTGGLIYLRPVLDRLVNLQSYHYQDTGIENPLIQIPTAVSTYLELLIFPQNLTFYHQENVFISLLYVWRLLVFIAFVATMIISFKKNKTVFFWLSFFVISLLVTLTPFRLGWIVAERYAYLGTIGICAVVALLLQKIGKLTKLRTLTYVLFFLILIAFSVRTILRNTDWKDEDTLWLATVKTSPLNPKSHNNMGDYYTRHGDLQKAAEEFIIAIKLKPNYGDAYHNLANTYNQMGKYDEALIYYQKALEINPNIWQSYLNMGAIYYYQKKDIAKTVEYLERAYAINQNDSSLTTNLGIAYLRNGEKERARDMFRRALKIDPNNSLAQKGLAETE